MSVRFHTDLDHHVLCARFIGAVSGPEGLNRLRAHHEAHPVGLNYNQIFDMRSWAGYLADQDLVEHFRWCGRSVSRMVWKCRHCRSMFIWQREMLVLLQS